jgi:hypothetical protein
MKLEALEAIAGVIILIAVLCSVPTCIREEKECEAKGGVFKYFSDDYTWLCLSKDAVVR